MTLPFERTNAVLNTQSFLFDLLDPKKTPRVPRAIRLQARQLLKHYPSAYDMSGIFENRVDSVFGTPEQKYGSRKTGGLG